MGNKVLIVEDEFIVANDLRIILQRAGYAVSGIVASGEEVEEILKKNKPDLALLDIQLKGKLSGIDVARSLRAEHIAFIYLSAFSSQQILEEVKKTEPYGFLVKPFRERDLLAALEIALYRHRHSFESIMMQEELLKKKLAEISKTTPGASQILLNLARLFQSDISFDLISFNSGQPPTTQPNDIAYLRIGYDEYQFIADKELMNITGLKQNDLSKINVACYEEATVVTCNLGATNKKDNNPSLQQLLMDTFSLQSYIVFPCILSDGNVVQYFFYSRQKEVYTRYHIQLLNLLKAPLTNIAESIMCKEPLAISSRVQPAVVNNQKNQSESHPAFSGIIGNHHLLLAALDLAAQVAPYNTSVLVLGESGTGKEKVAGAIHSLSTRKNRPFVKVNCAAIPGSLIESELFGHEKGAFTGAIEKRKGRFEQADGGTIFLDEIGELPLETQVKLLRVLQEKEIQTVGGSSITKVNVRIVAATNRNLEKEVAEGRFRADLYYRLNVFPISLPSLRERKTDIEALTVYFAKQFCKEFNKPFTGISGSMMEELYSYNWPGNIRELSNVLEQSVVLNDGKSAIELKRSLASNAAESPARANINTLEDVKNLQRQTEREYVISILKKVNGRIRGINGAAELLNLKPTTLESKMAKLRIKKDDFLNSTDNQ